jgi:GNAT superfamily N-acetyltransferase
VDREAVLADFNEQMRRNPAVDSGARVERADHVTRAVSTGTAIGWNGVLWTDLSDADADMAISAQLSRFAEIGEPWEWKHYSYDQPADLPQRLQQAGLVPAEPEALLIAEIADLDFLDTPPPAGVELVPVTDEAEALRVVRLHDAVFGGDHARTGAEILAGLAVQPQSVAAVLAMAGDTAICAGRVEFPPGRDFASLWGGGTLPEWRGRGVFRSLVAYRARQAQDRGYRYLQVDASPDSRPILKRLGFAELAMTTPFEHHGYAS